jgi:hypothetical protein
MEAGSLATSKSCADRIRLSLHQGDAGREGKQMHSAIDTEHVTLLRTTATARGGWSSHALSVLERGCEHYGGLATWNALRAIRLIPHRLSGFVPWLKGNGRSFPLPSVIEIHPQTREARFLNYPDEEQVGIFQNGKLRLERRETGELVAESLNHRQTFSGLARYRRWSAMDALYFFGYALTHYHSLPFSLYAARLVRATVAHLGSDRLDVLDVELPADLPTHGRRQSFYFNQSGQLVRHDYHSEIVGFWARGAHYWNRQQRVNGVPIAMERHVVGRLGKVPCPLVALHATFVGAEVELDRGNSLP